MTLSALLESLASEECPHCHRVKVARQTLCNACYRALPRATALALYRRVGEGYEAAFEAAINHLAALDEREQAKLFGGGS